MHRIELTPEAVEDLVSLKVFDRRRIVDGVEAQLTHEPTRETRNRKRLRPNQLAEWELRVQKFRIFYDVLADEANPVVKVIAVGYKEGNDLFIHGEKYEL
jgi:mRNA-degrading endonuclease RelE of RelBE toxin-antitoxin system